METLEYFTEASENQGANSRKSETARLLYLALNHGVEFEREILIQSERQSSDSLP